MSNPTPEQLREYNAYYDYAELCNEIPLCFQEWFKTQQGYEVPACA